MKKILIILLIIIIGYSLKNDKYNEIDDSIRFRVIANSNSPEDILIKEIVVDRLSKVLFINSENKDEVDDNINSNLSYIESTIENVFKEYNYNKKFYMSYGLNEIPEKTFLGKTYKKGMYKSLIIEIGAGEGDNYFCILYPSLCLIDYKSNTQKEKYSLKIEELLKKHSVN